MAPALPPLEEDLVSNPTLGRLVAWVVANRLEGAVRAEARGSRNQTPLPEGAAQAGGFPPPFRGPPPHERRPAHPSSPGGKAEPRSPLHQGAAEGLRPCPPPRCSMVLCRGGAWSPPGRGKPSPTVAYTSSIRRRSLLTREGLSDTCLSHNSRTPPKERWLRRASRLAKPPVSSIAYASSSIFLTCLTKRRRIVPKS